mmetsp:Transcript_60930/g.84745  ORF Transcript_60930/g.84745 Transcript_60930/m.84745 type:complete len:166 (+) Transcript_60930:105-602(+)
MSRREKGSRKRLMKELVDSRAGTQGAADHVFLEPVDEHDLSQWTIVLTPEKGSLYESGQFKIAVTISDRYPIQPPLFRFLTPVCHPNVHATSGEICLDVLKDEWSPAWTLHAAALAILVLLDNPDPTSPLNCDAGNLLRSEDRRAYNSLVRTYTSLHASEDLGCK